MDDGRADLSSRRDRPISDEPMVNAIHRRIAEFAFFSYTALLIYMSLVPFDFTRHAAPWSGADIKWGLAFSPFSLKDILANICFYVPVGMMAQAVWRRRGIGRIVSGLLSTATGFGISYAVEFAQRWVVSRCATWEDLSANTLGAFIGAAIIAVVEAPGRRFTAQVRSAAGRNWPLAFGQVALCLLLLVQIRPYDVVVNPVHTAGTLRHVDPSPLAGWHNVRNVVAAEVAQGRRQGMHELPRAQWEYVLDRIADTAGYAAVSALLVLGLVQSLRSRVAACTCAGLAVVFVAAMVTGIRVFLISHGFDTAHFVCGVVGWIIGCLIGCRLAVARRSAMPATPPAAEWGVGKPSPALSARWRNVLVAGVLAFVALYELVPFDFGTGPGGASPAYARRVCLVPFLAHFHARPNDAFYTMSGEILLYTAFGVGVAILLRGCLRWSWRRQLAMTLGLVAVAASGFEGLHLLMASRQTDVTTILLAIAGAFSGAVAVRWTTDYRASLGPTVVEDLLTHQLISGETYKPLPVPPSKPAPEGERQESGMGGVAP